MTILLFTFLARAAAPSPDANAIVAHSVEALRSDWRVAPHYDYFERDRGDHGYRVYHVMMIRGSPYRQLVSVNGVPLSPGDGQKEEEKLEDTVARRCAESKQQTDQRVQQYRKDVQRDHQLMEQLTNAFRFRLLGEQRVAGHKEWLLQATPRPGYQPPNMQTKVLTGMQGKLWIDEATFQWARVEAQVIHPVSMEGFLAKVEPGTRFGLEKAPVQGGAWLPVHFTVRSSAEIVSLFTHKTYDDETYFNYQKADSVKAVACPGNRSASGAAP